MSSAVMSKYFLASKLKTSQTGASSVEFALLAWLLFAIIFLTIEFGIWSTYQTFVTSSARDASIEFSLTRSSDSALKRAITTGANLTPALSAPQVTFYAADALGELKTIVASEVTDNNPATGACTPGQKIAVAVSYPRSLVTGFTGLLTNVALPPFVAKAVSICE